MTVASARKILGIEGKVMSDDDIELLLSNFYGIADVVIDQITKNGSNGQLKVIDSGTERINNETS